MLHIVGELEERKPIALPKWPHTMLSHQIPELSYAMLIAYAHIWSVLHMKYSPKQACLQRPVPHDAFLLLGRPKFTVPKR